MLDKIISAISTEILNPIIILMFAVALLVFLWGLVQFIRKANEADALETAKRHVMYGLIGMAIMISAFGILKLITGTFGINTSNTLDAVEK